MTEPIQREANDGRGDHGAVIGRTVGDSTPWFPRRPRPKGAPNVVMVVLDDTGFAQLGPFGSDVATPTLDRLAAEGLRYNRFHVTAICSPTRASVLTGRNHHAVGMGFLCDLPTGFPGYTARLPRSAATLARVLRDEGYSTLATGKWHLTPATTAPHRARSRPGRSGWGSSATTGSSTATPTTGPRRSSPTTTTIEAPRRPEEGYHLSEDLVDQSLRLVVDQHHATPDKPFFLYFASGAMHAPHHVAPRVERAVPGPVRRRLGAVA